MKLILTLLFVAVAATGFSQHQNIYFFKNNGTEVKVRDSADFIRIVQEADSTTENYRVTEYYKNGKPKLVGESSTIDPIVYEGTAIFYEINGKKQAITEFKGGKIVSQHMYTYYPNGRLQSVRDYPDPNYNPLENYLLLTYNDTTGKALIINGEGYFIGNDVLIKERYNEGKMAYGKKEGEWKGSYTNDKTTFIENYKSGWLLSGTCITKDGKKYSYNRENNPPCLNIKNTSTPIDFRAGFVVNRTYTFSMKSFSAGSPMPIVGGRLIGAMPNTAIPANSTNDNSSFENRSAIDAAQNDEYRLARNGKVNVSFIIDKKGIVRNIAVSKSLDDKSDQTALSAVSDYFKRNKSITPGILYGRPVDTPYTISVILR